MRYLKKFNTMEEPKDSKSLNERAVQNEGNIKSQIDHYQKLFDEAYEKGDKFTCKKYDKILVDLWAKI